MEMKIEKANKFNINQILTTVSDNHMMSIDHVAPPICMLS